MLRIARCYLFTNALKKTLHVKNIISVVNRTPNTRKFTTLFRKVTFPHHQQWKIVFRIFRIFTSQKSKITLSIALTGCYMVIYKRINSSYCFPYKKPTRIEEDSEKNDSKFEWRVFLNFLYPDLFYFIIAVIGSVVVAIVNTYLPVATGNLLDEVMRVNAHAQGVLRDILPLVMGKAIKIAVLYSLQGGLTFLAISALTIMGERMSRRLRTELFKSLIEQDIEFFDNHKTSELVSRLSSDIQDLKSGFKLLIGQGIRNSIQTIGCAINIFLLSKELSLTITASVLLIVFIGSIFGSVLRKWSRQAQAQTSNTLAIADESLSNIRTVRSLGREKFEEEKFEDKLEDVFHLNNRLGLGIAAFQGVSSVVINGLFLVVLAHGGSLIAGNHFSPGNMLSVVVATQTLQRSLGSLSILFGQVIRGWTGGSRVFEYISIKPTIPVSGGVKLKEREIVGIIEFRDVLFGYPTRKEQDILHEFNLTLEPGKVTALWGPSGAGKSTVASLLQRFYDPEEGGIYLDGVNYKYLDATWLRGNVLGVISQEPILFATSVKENIKYGKTNATDEEIVEAAKIANAHDFIANFPDGYDTELGERGLLISAGQKQRIAIARAFLRDPKILILDEATSALDPVSEKLVQDALNKLVKKRTVLVISHRESIVKNADKIVLLSHGKVLKQGTYAEIYWALYEKDIKDIKDKIN
ncbi:ATP-binding cassette sub-family B member 8, mitochondrial-like [Oopsacas minuta]|uniref:Mitochondrial potassium channel ATP-binding subunit n=1 Tax=Oopsacas minuta TaxID=111878 RepID=A0AAV7JYG7_9METZ|nr:ATP-binding cassette sub-family B member 8, mitochondrial-like [Oopsacas minuta]